MEWEHTVSFVIGWVIGSWIALWMIKKWGK